MDKILSKLFLFFEDIIFFPKLIFLPYYIILLPFSIIYILINIVLSLFSMINSKDYGIKVISIGNLVLGGTGKSPLTIKLANIYSKSAIVLRGYNKDSKDSIILARTPYEILCNDSNTIGDEAKLYTLECNNSYVIVASNKTDGVKYAKKLGATVVFIDDGYRKFDIKNKLDIVISSSSKNLLPFPAGPYRNILYPFKSIIKVKDGVDFKRIVDIKNETNKMFCISAISKPSRLKKYFNSNVIGHKFYKDHHKFSKVDIEDVYKKSNAETLLVTKKDEVKLSDFGIKLSILEIDIDISNQLAKKIDEYIKS